MKKRNISLIILIITILIVMFKLDSFFKLNGLIFLFTISVAIIIVLIFLISKAVDHNKRFSKKDGNPFYKQIGIYVGFLIALVTPMMQNLSTINEKPSFVVPSGVKRWTAIALEKINVDSEWMHHKEYIGSQEIALSISSDDSKSLEKSGYKLGDYWTRIDEKNNELEFKTYLHPNGVEYPFHNDLIQRNKLNLELYFIELMRTGYININGLVNTPGNKEFFVRNPNKIEDFPFTISINKIVVNGNTITTDIHLSSTNGEFFSHSIDQWNGWLFSSEIQEGDQTLEKYFLIKVQTVFGQENVIINEIDYDNWGIENFITNDKKQQLVDYFIKRGDGKNPPEGFVENTYRELGILNNVILSVLEVGFKKHNQ